MKFFKNLKQAILGSIKEDLNSALGGKQALFNSKIAGALDDLIAMKTGINISNIPQSISEEALLSAEDRKSAEADIESRGKAMGRVTPKMTEILKFPKSDTRFVDNWIIFRTIKRPISDLGATPQDGVFSTSDYGVISSKLGDEQEGPPSPNKGMSKEYTIAMYFPTGVRDNISVEYEAKEVGLSDIALDSLMQGEFGTLLDAAGGAFGETFQKAKQAAVAFSSFESGLVVDNPKFNTFQGVGFRDHSYSFTLYPYNETDAEEITRIVHAFKMMMLPMSSSKNRRIQLMPAEWSIDFQGPILGHIEHPQNCFLKSCDVDYSGGKDMSFIEGFTQSKEGTPQSEDGVCRPDDKLPVKSAVQHYPNGINLNLVFQEILNIDRLRYVQRVASSAMGAEQKVQQELDEFEKQVNAEVTDEVIEDQNFGSEEAAKEYIAKHGLGSEVEVYLISGTELGDTLDSNVVRGASILPGIPGMLAAATSLSARSTGNSQRRYGIRRKNPQGNQTG